MKGLKQDKFRSNCLNIRTRASPKVGQDQVSGGISVPCWHATPVAYIPLKTLQFGDVKFGKMVRFGLNVNSG